MAGTRIHVLACLPLVSLQPKPSQHKDAKHMLNLVSIPLEPVNQFRGQILSGQCPQEDLTKFLKELLLIIVGQSPAHAAHAHKLTACSAAVRGSVHASADWAFGTRDGGWPVHLFSRASPAHSLRAHACYGRS